MTQHDMLMLRACLMAALFVYVCECVHHRGLQVSGFNVRKALAADTPKGAEGLRALLSSLGKLVGSGLLTHDFTEYSFAEEFQEAVEHAVEAPGASRVLLRMN